MCGKITEHTSEAKNEKKKRKRIHVTGKIADLIAICPGEGKWQPLVNNRSLHVCQSRYPSVPASLPTNDTPLRLRPIRFDTPIDLTEITRKTLMERRELLRRLKPLTEWLIDRRSTSPIRQSHCFTALTYAPHTRAHIRTYSCVCARACTCI